MRVDGAAASQDTERNRARTAVAESDDAAPAAPSSATRDATVASSDAPARVVDAEARTAARSMSVGNDTFMRRKALEGPLFREALELGRSLQRGLQRDSAPVAAPDAQAGQVRAMSTASTSGIDAVADGTTLRRGSNGTDVERLQRRLNELGYDAGTADGAFGPRTEGAVKAFQTNNALGSDGVVGPLTLGKLKSADAAPAAAPTDPVDPVDPTDPVDPVDPVTPTGGVEASRQALAAALNRGYQYLIGEDFNGGKSKLLASGKQGLAILDKAGATESGVAQLKNAGVVPYAYNNAFQTQPGEQVPAGVGIIGGDPQWGELVPDFTDSRWQNRRIAEAKDAAVKGFGGVMLDNVPRAGTSAAAADYIKRMAVEARAASDNPAFAILLQNGEALVKAHPWLVEQGYVAGLQKEDVSYRVNGAGTGTGVSVSSSERAEIRANFDAIRARHPKLPTIAVDYPSSNSQAEQARANANSLGFNLVHIAQGDGQLSRISNGTRLLRPANES